MGEIKSVGKLGVNQKQGYKYQAADDICAVIQPILAKLGIFHSSKVLERDYDGSNTTKDGIKMHRTILTVEHTYYASDGSSVTQVTVGEAMDTSDKSSNKAYTASEKYSHKSLFLLPSYEEEADAASPEVKGNLSEDDVNNWIMAIKESSNLKSLADVKKAIGGIKDRASKEQLASLWVEYTKRAEELKPNGDKAINDSLGQEWIEVEDVLFKAAKGAVSGIKESVIQEGLAAWKRVNKCVGNVSIPLEKKRELYDAITTNRFDYIHGTIN